MLTVPRQEDGTSSQGALGHCSERIQKTLSTQKIETQLVQCGRGHTIVPQKPHGKREHPQLLTRGVLSCSPAARRWASSCPAPALCLEAAGAACWMPSAAENCDRIKRCWGYPLADNHCLCRVHPFVVHAVLRSLLQKCCILACRKVHTGD